MVFLARICKQKKYAGSWIIFSFVYSCTKWNDNFKMGPLCGLSQERFLPNCNQQSSYYPTLYNPRYWQRHRKEATEIVKRLKLDHIHFIINFK
jgi:hypothetical protein